MFISKKITLNRNFINSFANWASHLDIKNPGWNKYFGVLLAKNAENLDAAIKDIQQKISSYPDKEGLATFNAGIQKIVNKYAKKNEKKEIILDNNGNTFIEDKINFEKEKTAYEELNKDFMVSYSAFQETINAWMNEPLEIIIVQMPFEKFPDFFIDTKFYQIFSSDLALLG